MMDDVDIVAPEERRALARSVFLGSVVVLGILLLLWRSWEKASPVFTEEFLRIPAEIESIEFFETDKYERTAMIAVSFVVPSEVEDLRAIEAGLYLRPADPGLRVHVATFRQDVGAGGGERVTLSPVAVPFDEFDYAKSWLERDDLESCEVLIIVMSLVLRDGAEVSFVYSEP